MSVFRIVLLGTYLAGILGLAMAVLLRLGLSVISSEPKGALAFSGVCFLCTLATREVAAMLEKPKEEPKARAAAA